MLEKGFFQKAHSERQKELYFQSLKLPEDRLVNLPNEKTNARSQIIIPHSQFIRPSVYQTKK